MWGVTVNVVSTVGIHWHVVSDLLHVLTIDFKHCNASLYPHVYYFLSPGIKDTAVPPACPAISCRVVLPHLSRSNHIALALNCTTS